MNAPHAELPQIPFWFLRHGETDYNARGLAQGALDIPLNETGRAQAANAGVLLANRGIASIVCSPMLRARETAAIVNEKLNLPISFAPDLREVAYGEMEGQSLTTWFQDWVDGVATPVGAESFAALSNRLAIALQSVLVPPGPILIVAHGAVFRAVRDLMGAGRQARTPNGHPFYCTPSKTGWSVRP